ncbi:phage tail assembly chaperone [Sphingorhabdus sp. 109]|uniref:phage tail assembly chaperone n=1 Tax=Sphingorhabdus sp. 109 TaxID=2653173 RepID=UPI0012F1CABD|nr:phage tail assembly chaperone [Sphingorhabdus sp. 109]VWX62618.1 Phage tail assembly chaperone [Sphingorhabdus sp. 109]
MNKSNKYYSPSTTSMFDEAVHGVRQIAVEQTSAEIKARKRPKMVPNPACTIPSDAVSISHKQWEDLLEQLNHHGKVLEPGAKTPRAVDPPKSAEEVVARNRTQRDRLLAASDWTQLADVPIIDASRGQWQVYRQQLRDLDLSDPEWPVAPDDADATA